MSEISFDEDKKALSNVSREAYGQIFDILAKNIHKYGGGLSFNDLKRGANNESIADNQLVSDLGSEEDIVSLLNKTNKDYSSKESEDFILDVKASNITDISDSGYFYKKLASCMDNVSIAEEDCGSEGRETWINNLIDPNTSDDFFNYKVKDLYVTEFGHSYKSKDKLVDDMKNNKLESIHVRTPIECKTANTRCFCRKCCGNMSAGENVIDSDNVGIIATLAITEHVTQGSLSSMNNGREENVNVVLERGFPIKRGTFEEYKNIIIDVINQMGYVGVEARWYEIALLGRIYQKDNGMYVSTTFKNSSNYVVDPLGCFLFSPSLQHLQKLVGSNTNSIVGENDFEIDSCKAKNLFNLV